MHQIDLDAVGGYSSLLEDREECGHSQYSVSLLAGANNSLSLAPPSTRPGMEAFDGPVPIASLSDVA